MDKLKLLVTTQDNLTGKGKLLSVSMLRTVENETVSIMVVDDVGLKENQHREFEWDEINNTVKVIAVDSPKTSEQQLEERLEAQARAIEELLELMGGDSRASRIANNAFI